MAHLPDPACVYGKTDLREIASDIYAAAYNLSVDTHGPILLSATINADGDELTLVFDEPVTGNAGFTLAMTGGAATLAYSSGDGTTTLVFTTSRTIYALESGTLAYTPGDVEDLNGNPLAAFTVFAVTNNSTQVIANLQGWYDISDAATVTKDGANAVSAWNDKSGNARHFLQATGSAQPIWVSNQYNGRPTLRFDGGSDFMAVTTNWMSGIAAFTIFAVVQTDVVAANNCILTGSSQDRFQQTNSGAGVTQYNFAGGGSTTYPTTDTALHVRAVQFNGALAQALRCSGWLDGVAQAVVNAALPATTGANTNIRLGRFTTASAFWNGDICELMLYNRALTTTEVGVINGVLLDKWL